MAQDTYESLWRGLLLRVPLAPIPLIQQAVNSAYRRASRMYDWSALRSESEWYVAAPYTTGTVTLTNGSTAVTGSGTVWDTTHTDRQLVVVPYGYYTFTFLTTTTGTLSRAWAGPTVTGQAYSLVKVYQPAPADFNSLEEVRSPVNSWRLRINWTQQDIDRFDPQRSVSADPWAVVAAPYTAQVGGTLLFELWPRPTGPVTLAFRYRRDVADLSALSDTPIEPIDGDILRDGALAELALWPGTTAERNPYFSPAQNAAFEKRFLDGLANAQSADQGRNLTDIQPADRYAPGFPITASFLQSHIVGV